jgi:DNA-directed RNA polymerase specialized sigma24 family protein
MPTETFRDFVHRIRAGDGAAAEELVRRYEPVIRMEVRTQLRLAGPAPGRLFESRDICQSVLASFFVRMAAGQYDLDDPRRLTNLLLAMARRKLASQIRRHHRVRRDCRRLAPAGGEALGTVGIGPTPDQIVAGRELLDQVSQRLTPQEWLLAERRAHGERWAAIARELGGTAQARRKQLARGLDRVLRELGLEDARDE